MTDKAIVVAPQAPLPTLYENAKVAILECDSIDEVADWADRMLAMGVYARQSKDDTLRKAADRIQARAVRRVGELLQEIPRETAGQKVGKGGEPPPKSPRKEAAQAAGLSPDQAKQAIRVANVPEDEFEADVESDDPPTVTELAERGKKPAPRQPDGELDRAVARKAIAAIAKFHKMCGETDPAAVARGITTAERKALLDQAGAIAVWARWLTRELEK